MKNPEPNTLNNMVNEEHYTPQDVIDMMFQVRDKYVDFEITQYLEPSAGDGRMIEGVDKPFIAYDINPKSDKVIHGDFLTTDISYLKGRLTIMCPPFSLVHDFVEKTLDISDYVIAMLPRQGLTNVINYETTHVDCAYMYKEYDFGTTVTTFFIVGCRRRLIGDGIYQPMNNRDLWVDWLKLNSNKPIKINHLPPFDPEFVKIIK
jgi:hypothetical protein